MDERTLSSSAQELGEAGTGLGAAWRCAAGAGLPEGLAALPAGVSTGAARAVGLAGAADAAGGAGGAGGAACIASPSTGAASCTCGTCSIQNTWSTWTGMEHIEHTEDREAMHDAERSMLLGNRPSAQRAASSHL